MTLRTPLLSVAALAVVLAQPLGAAETATSTVAISATVSAMAKLDVGVSTLTFPAADPDSSATIAPTEGAVTITAKAKTSKGSTVELTLLADGDLTSGSDAIDISNLTWTVSGTGFKAGTMNKTTAQQVASWTDSGNKSGTQTFALANLWSYPTGSFTAHATYTLTAP